MNETSLIDFAQDFGPALGPLLQPLETSTRVLAETHDQEIERTLVPTLRDASHQLSVLLEKVAEQQTYVLVFGPLKSGKSSLMNALAAAYVSEVTALPAYPCMVFVSHAPTSSFEISRYDGTSEVLRDPVALQELVDEAHAELAQELSAAEQRGEEFDPAIHHPRALRRIDVRLPAEELRTSGAVLVDTPGLYTRMKFGYDTMTRDFRNAAACAVFVVKTDNLFLEQVFDEFEELLDLFSRIFLVVNVDTSKQDVGPDGRLVPSAEAVNPGRVVEAFERYSMKSKMRDALAEGRLCIHTVDLLHAASRRLRNEREELDDPAAFAPLQNGLVEFLGSSDYLVTFLRDSLTQGERVVDRMGEALASPILGEIGRSLEEDRQALAAAESDQAALERLIEVDWSASVDAFDERVRGHCARGFETAEGRAVSEVDRALAEWLRSDDSLAELRGSCESILVRHDLACTATVRELLVARADRGESGLELSTEVTADLRRIGLDLGDLVRHLEIEAQGEEIEVSVPLDTEEIPVKRAFVDWILFRGKATIRRRLFGPPERPTQSVPADLKAARLGEDAGECLKRAVGRTANTLFPKQRSAAQRALLGARRTAFLAHVRAMLEARRPAAAAQVSSLGQRVRLAEGVLGPVHELGARLELARAELATITERFFPAPTPEPEPEPEPEFLLEPMERSGDVAPDELPATEEDVPVAALEGEDENPGEQHHG